MLPPLPAAPAADPADPADPAEQACRRAWQWLREPAVRALLAGPDAHLLRRAPALADALHDAFNAGRLPGVLIKNEVRRALRDGATDATLLALVLLAAVALERFHGGAHAHALAGACAVRARQPDAAGVAGAVLRIHATLLARAVPLRDAASVQAEACRIDMGRLDACAGAAARPDTLARSAVLWSGVRMLAGAPLAELLHYLRTVQAARRRLHPAAPASTAGAQLAGRIALLQLLADGADGAAGVANSTPARSGARQFACWLTMLQRAWFEADPVAARAALDGAARALGPLTAPCELLPYHLFAALVLAHMPDGAAGPDADARAGLRTHRRALQAWARRMPEQAGAMAALAHGAELERSAGGRALGAYERAAALAQVHAQPWIAALAWEGAAGLAARQGLAGALPGYRRLALDAWRGWGAQGRVRMLTQAWDGTLAAECAEQARAARADTVGELGITIAHEVNQPLAAILLHAAAARRWLRRGQPDAARALEALEQISACGRQAGNIIRSVRGLARREGEDACAFALDAALAEVVQLLRALMQRQNVQLDTRLQLPDVQLHASRTQVQQVLMNLLLNAAEALAGVSGRPRRIQLESCALGSTWVELRVLDNGPGIAPEARARMFDALYSTKPHGTGIGLSLSRGIVEAHGGRIEFVPVEPHGALFRVVLPLGGVAAGPLPAGAGDHA
jgi:signal transduction histidine kinase